MSINKITSFAGGILLATLICGVVYFSDSNEKKVEAKPANNQKIEKIQLTEQEMIDQLVASGYVVNKNEDNEQTKTDEKQQETAEDTSSNVTKVVVNVANGMTSIDVGRTLEQAQLVPNAFNFSKDIESKGLQNKLKPGTYVVDSSMTYDQIIATIFNQ